MRPDARRIVVGIRISEADAARIDALRAMPHSPAAGMSRTQAAQSLLSWALDKLQPGPQQALEHRMDALEQRQDAQEAALAALPHLQPPEVDIDALERRLRERLGATDW
jgi:hypothetical protein